MKPRMCTWTAVAAILAAGCTARDDGSGMVPLPSGPGRVHFFVHDEPTDNFSAVFVRVSKVEVHRSAAESETTTRGPSSTNGTTSRTTGSWTTIVDRPFTVDLLRYQGDARALVGSSELTPGTYTQVRLTVEELYGMTSVNGSKQRVPIELPSQSLRIVRPWSLPPEGDLCLEVDFDLNESLELRGSGEWMFKPTLKLATRECPAPSNGGSASPSTRRA